MQPLIIAVVNQSTVESDAQVQARLQDLDDQINLDVAPIWQLAPVQSVFVPKGHPVPPNASRVELILDDATQAGALGYHSSGGQGETVPTSYIFSKTSLADGAQPSVVHSHERVECAADPFIANTVNLDVQIGGFRGGYSAIVMLELCDGPEADQFGYKRGNTLLSNFVTPAWFSMPWAAPAGISTHQFDFLGNVTAAFGLTGRGQPVGLNSGGYIALRLTRLVKDWYQVQGRESSAMRALEVALPPDSAHVLSHDGTRLAPATICPLSRRGRWLKKHGG